MTALHLLLTACAQGKGPEDAVFTLPNGVPFAAVVMRGNAFAARWEWAIQLNGLQSAFAHW